MDCAVLFIPSESLFLRIVDSSTSGGSRGGNIVVEAHKAKLWLASPTTLIAVLTTLQVTMRHAKLRDNVQSLVSEVTAMDGDLKRLEVRYAKAEKQLDQARETLRLTGVSMDKVVRRRTKMLLGDPFED